MKTDGMSSEKRKCVICGHKTQRYKSWSYVDGIEILVPVCDNCIDNVGWCLDPAMDVHLKAIAQSVRMSNIITADEKLIMKMRRETIYTEIMTEARRWEESGNEYEDTRELGVS